MSARRAAAAPAAGSPRGAGRRPTRAPDPGHTHPHDHHAGHAGHASHVGREADRRYLVAALVLLGGFLLVEVALGIVAGSLALLSDAAHMLTDVGALVLALVAMRLADQPARGRYTFGLKRVEILSAQINGVTLVALGGWLGFEGVRRLFEPQAVAGALVLGVALAGVAVNIAATWLLSRANRSSLNVEGAFQHMLTDLYAFLGTAVAGIVIVLTGYYRADAIAALVVAALMLRSGFVLLRESGKVLLEAAPASLDLASLETQISQTPGVVGVHDLHVWEVTSGFPSLSAHVLVAPDQDCHTVRSLLQQRLADQFDITHTTLQVDHAGEQDVAAAPHGCCVQPHPTTAPTVPH